MLGIPEHSSRGGNYIRTFTGKAFWPLDPHAEEVDIIDIAHSLSNICRYTGHCKQHYSVAQHSLVVDFILRKHDRLGLGPLLHDAPEAYLSDIARPVKILPFMDEMRFYQDKIERVIFHKFGVKLSSEDRELIKIADNAALCAEAKLLMHSSWSPKQFDLDGEMYQEALIATDIITGFDIPKVKETFLGVFDKLYKEYVDSYETA